MKLPRIKEVQAMNTRGPWQSKSGGTLNLLLTMPFNTFPDHFFQYDWQELQKIPIDLRGLRTYTVRRIPVDGIGGREFHRIRQEIVFAIEGRLRWTCEDLYGKKKELLLTPTDGVYQPPFIMHTCEALEENSGILVICNTLFVPEDARTHDTYSQEIFSQIQQVVSKGGQLETVSG